MTYDDTAAQERALIELYDRVRIGTAYLEMSLGSHSALNRNPNVLQAYTEMMQRMKALQDEIGSLEPAHESEGESS